MIEQSDAVRAFEALAHGARLAVLRRLVPAGPRGMPAGEIGAALGLAPTRLSFHLSRLAAAGLVEGRREGRHLYYAVRYPALGALVRFLAADCCAGAPEGCLPDCPPLPAGCAGVTETEGGRAMQFHQLTPREWTKAVAVGIANGLLLSAVMVPLNLGGISPFPKPVGLAFAETVLGGPLPLPVGLLFHLVYVTFWSVAFVAFARDRLTLGNALILAAVLWLGALVVFFPVIGWGFLGLGIGPQLIVAAAVPHLLFGLFLWGLCRLAFGRGDTPAGPA